MTALSGHAGTSEEATRYDAFGTALNLQSPGTGNDLLFTGRELDRSTGLYYYRARYYDPEIGRFLSEDALGFGAGVNFYAYVGNNPVNFNDPSGHCATICLGVIAGTGAAVGSWWSGGTDAQIARAFGVGFVAGATLGFGTGLVAPALASGGASVAGAFGVPVSQGAVAATSTLIQGTGGAVLGDAVTQGWEHLSAGGSVDNFDYSGSRGLAAGVAGFTGSGPAAVASYSLKTAQVLYGSASWPAQAYTLGTTGEIAVGALDTFIGASTGMAINQVSESWNTWNGTSSAPSYQTSTDFNIDYSFPSSSTDTGSFDLLYNTW